jgi:hypothetical protein
MPAPATGPARSHGPRALVAVVVLVPVLVGLALAAFAWPAARLAPRDLPIGLVAPAAAGQGVEQWLAADGAIEVHRYADEPSARAAIADREVYGAIVATPQGTAVLTASAASPLVAQLLQQAAAAAPSGGGPAAAPATRSRPGASPVRVVDVVPADPDDPRGAALAASLLPLVLAGTAAGLLVWLGGGPGTARAAALAGASVVAGLVAVGIAQGWLGVLGGGWLANAGVLGLTVLAVGATVAGLAVLFGRAGAALGALLIVLVGNPLSGISTAPELLPEPAGAIGQLLPPGAGGSLLRSTAFFDGAGAAAPLTVLVVWAGLGLAAIWLGSWFGSRRLPSAAGAEPGPGSGSTPDTRPIAIP